MFGKKHENTNTGVVVYHYELEEDTSEISLTISNEHDPDASTTSGNHCAWCGDPPDRYGSHGICAWHAAQLVEQARGRFFIGAGTPSLGAVRSAFARRRSAPVILWSSFYLGDQFSTGSQFRLMQLFGEPLAKC